MNYEEKQVAAGGAVVEERRKSYVTIAPVAHGSSSFGNRVE